MKKRKTSKNMPIMFHSSLPQHRLRKVKVVKSRYHLQKVFFPLCAIAIVLVCTLILLNYPLIKEHIEFLIPKNKYLIYGLVGFVNLFVIIYCGFIIKEYFTLSIVLQEKTLKVKHYVPIRLDIHNIDDVTLKHSMLGKMLGYSTLTILNKNRSVLRYVDIINGPQLRRAIKKIQKQQNEPTTKKTVKNIFSSPAHNNNAKPSNTPKSRKGVSQRRANQYR